MYKEIIESSLKDIPKTTVYLENFCQYKMRNTRVEISVRKFTNADFGECYAFKANMDGRPLLSQGAPMGTTEYYYFRKLYIAMQDKYFQQTER